MENHSFIQQLMLPQLLNGGIEALFNQWLKRSPHSSKILAKLAGKVLKIELNSPHLSWFVLFDSHHCDWLGDYQGECDCEISLNCSALPQLVDRQKLTALINDKSLILKGDIQVLQHFVTLLDELEKDPAELLSPYLGDVMAQLSTDFVKSIYVKTKQQWQRHSHHLVDNLTTERPVLVHTLQLADFCDQVNEVALQVAELERKIAQFQCTDLPNRPKAIG